MLNRVATVTDEGTVQLNVPGDFELENADLRSTFPDINVSDEESANPTEIQELPPRQIVMLIVGTRGDVQPFVAIGKRLQVRVTTYSLVVTWASPLF